MAHDETTNEVIEAAPPETSDKQTETLNDPQFVSIDKDVLQWFKGQSARYESHINAVLRKYVQLHKQEVI